MKKNIYDIEIYPNYFLVNSIDYDSKEQKSFIIDENINQLSEIIEFIKEKAIFIGHNILGFDNLLLNYLLKNETSLRNVSNLEICQKLKTLCDRIINRKRNEKWESDLADLLNFKNFKCIDTLAIMNTIDRTGIKQASINLKYYNVQELPFEPNRILTQEEKDIVKEYCFNDCNISLLLYEAKIPDIELRKDVSKRYKLDVINANDTAIAKKILNKYYSEYTHLDIKDFKDLRSFNAPFLLNDIIPNIEFKTKPFQDLYDWFKKQRITEKTEILLNGEEKSEISYTLILDGISVKYALGGCHSIDKPKIFESTDDLETVDCDFASFYPNILINNNIKPRHVKQDFINIVKTLTEERILDKKEGRKKDAEIKKIVINSIYGLLGSDYYWLKDIKALLKITVTGQLILAKFLEDLYINGIQVISKNTDGILSIVKKDQKEKYLEICENMSKLYNIGVEYTYYKKYIRKDINNYLAITTNNEIKQKGKYFSTKIQLAKGYYYPIIAKALNKYYINNVPIEKTIKEHTDIYDFMCSQKVNTNKYNAEIHKFEDNEIKSIKLQKINRWIVTKSGGKFLKVEKDVSKENRLKKKIADNKVISQKDKSNKVIGIETENFLTIVNKIEDKPISDYNLDYQFYINLCNEIIDLISPRIVQMSLF